MIIAVRHFVMKNHTKNIEQNLAIDPNLIRDIFLTCIMNSVYTIMAVLAAIALIGSIGATSLQRTAFAIGNPELLPQDAKGHGDRVSSQAIGNPEIVPGTAKGHGEDVSNAARGPR